MEADAIHLQLGGGGPHGNFSRRVRSPYRLLDRLKLGSAVHSVWLVIWLVRDSLNLHFPMVVVSGLSSFPRCLPMLPQACATFLQLLGIVCYLVLVLFFREFLSSFVIFIVLFSFVSLLVFRFSPFRCICVAGVRILCLSRPVR